jgi:hypothetical protein
LGSGAFLCARLRDFRPSLAANINSSSWRVHFKIRIADLSYPSSCPNRGDSHA